ncbi:MAG: hypothetical protein ACI3ZK_05645 [Candidatus Cryptobacteroides sp.]
MKNKIFNFVAVSAALMAAACTAEESTIGSVDTTPGVTVYTYAPGSEYNADNDIRVRIVPNKCTDELYFAVLSDEEYKALAESSAEAVAAAIKENGKQLEATAVKDTVLTGLFGLNHLAAVAVGGGSSKVTEAEFVGVSWIDVATGVYSAKYYAPFGLEQYLPTTLQVADNDANRFRFKDVFGEGAHLEIYNYPDYSVEDEEGYKYSIFRISPQATPIIYNGAQVYIKDIGYRMNDASYVFNYGYESGMYEDYFCFICAQYYIPDVGNLTITQYDFFIPDSE